MGSGIVRKSKSCAESLPADNARWPVVGKVEWPTAGLIVACYAVWVAAGAFIWPAYPVAALVIMSVAIALHSSLCHEATHGHPTSNASVNEMLMFLPLGLVYPFRRFKTLHLRHHADDRLTDPFDDPESYYQALWKHEQLPDVFKLVLRLNNTLVGRLVLGPPLATIGLLLSDGRLIVQGDARVRLAWALHAVGLSILAVILHAAFGMPFWLYALTAAWAGYSIISLRTFAEHRWAERPDGRTLIVERSPLGFLFLNNNLHLVHHKNPNVAWYKLPGLFRSRRDEWLKMNDGYVFRNYSELLRKYAFRTKEPVVHPALRRAPEPGRAFGRSITVASDWKAASQFRPNRQRNDINASFLVT